MCAYVEVEVWKGCVLRAFLSFLYTQDYNCLDPNRGGPSSYDWVRHLLLGTKNMSKIYETIKQLQKIQQTEVLPPFDEFVQVFGVCVH